jgi:hypothetical protein
MNLPMLIVAFAAMGASVASAIVAWYKAFGAAESKKKAEEARDDAVTALARSATALEEANELVRKYAPRDEASWEIELTNFDFGRFQLRNVGISTAFGVTITAWPPEEDEHGRQLPESLEGLTGQIGNVSPEPRDMPANDVLSFMASSWTEPRMRLKIRWSDNAGETHQTLRDLP